MNIEVHVKSDIGRVRAGNEDNFLLLNLGTGNSQTIDQQSNYSANFPAIEMQNEGIVFAVSDGMGGALAGEVASQLAVEVLRDIMLGIDSDITLSPDDASLLKKLYQATINANRRIHQQSQEEDTLRGMGATLTAAAVSVDMVYLSQIGDSRAYLLRDGKIAQITKDQSLVQQLIDTGQISEKDAETHPLRNVILQALGAQSEVVPVCGQFKPLRRDIILLCSDGLSGKLRIEDIQEIVARHDQNLEAAVEEMVDEANLRGGEDNITLVLARFNGEKFSDEKGEISVETVFPYSDEYADTGDLPTLDE